MYFRSLIFIKEFLCSRATEKIYKRLPIIMNGDENTLFPALPGANLKTLNPALEFVKAVCKVCVFKCCPLFCFLFLFEETCHCLIRPDEVN